MTKHGAATPRAAIIGYGMAGRSIHARLLREAGWQVTAVLVNNDDRRADAQSDWPGLTLVRSVQELIAVKDRFDVVVVASPTGLHFEHASELLRAGIATVVDKPLGIDAQQCQELVDLAAELDGHLTVFQNRRWDSEQLTLKQLIADDELGQVHTFERRWERWRPVPLARWKEQDPVAGGLLLDLGAHLVDSAVELFGPVVRVHAQIRNLTTPTPDDVFISLEHGGENRPTVFSRLQAGALVGAPGPRTRVLGNKGSFVVTSYENEASPFSQLDTLIGNGSVDHEGWLSHGAQTTAVAAASGGHADFYRAVASWLTGTGPVPVDPRDCVYTAQILDAAQLSAAEHRVISMP